MIALGSLPVWLTARRTQHLRAADSPRVWPNHQRFLSYLALLIWLIWLPVNLWLDIVPWPLHVVLPATVLVGCYVLSYSIWQRWRGAGASARQFFDETLAFQLFEAMLFGSVPPSYLRMWGIDDTPQFTLGFLANIWLTVLATWYWLNLAARTIRTRQLLLGSWKKVLTAGELHDRMIQLAEQAEVKINTLLLVPAGPLRLSTAFTIRGDVVGVTDSLLYHLSRREVDTVLAHELGHVRRGHRQKLRPVVAVGCTLSVLVVIALMWSCGWGVARYGALGPLCGGFAITFLLTFAFRRRFEQEADAEALRLTGDPEACIRAILRITRMAHAPLDRSRWHTFQTPYPSPRTRIKAIAQEAGWSKAKLQGLIDANTEEDEGDHYPATGT